MHNYCFHVFLLFSIFRIFSYTSISFNLFISVFIVYVKSISILDINLKSGIIKAKTLLKIFISRIDIKLSNDIKCHFIAYFVVVATVADYSQKFIHCYTPPEEKG